MRGGDRFVHECSWMNGICFSFVPFNRDFLNLLTLATPHQPGLPVPKCRQSRQLPPGEAKRRLRELILFNVPICSRRGRTAKRLYHLQIVYSCNRPAKLLYFLAFCRIMCYAIPGATSTPVGGSPSNFSQGVNFLFIAPNPKQRGGGRCVRYME